MAKQPKKLTAAQLKKAARAEDDTVRAAHFARQAEGHKALEPLTEKSNAKRDKRNALIKGLPPIVPVIEALTGPNKPTTKDTVVEDFQNKVAELKATLAERDAQIDELTAPGAA